MGFVGVIFLLFDNYTGVNEMVEGIRERYVDKKYRKEPWSKLLDAPVYALNGVSSEDGEFLKRAFNIHTIQDLAQNRFVLVAQTIVSLAQIEEVEGM